MWCCRKKPSKREVYEEREAQIIQHLNEVCVSVCVRVSVRVCVCHALDLWNGWYNQISYHTYPDYNIDYGDQDHILDFRDF